MKKTILLLSLTWTIQPAIAQDYHTPDFYSALVSGKPCVRQEQALTTTYTLSDSLLQNDRLLIGFDSTLLTDSIELKFVFVKITTTEKLTNTNTSYLTTNTNVKEDWHTEKWLVGIRFTKHHAWIPISNKDLISRYLRSKHPSLARKYKKHMEQLSGGVAIAGVGTLLFALLFDGGFTLFVFHPYFIPVYAVGGAMLAVGGLIYLHHHSQQRMYEVVAVYNSQ